jgi:AcrR family transcriptional regulator
VAKAEKQKQPTVNRQVERSTLSDKRMFEAAINLINERGTAKKTLKDIGELAGYSRGLASYRFGSKDGLWMELFDKFDQLWKEHISGYVAGKTGLEALQSAILAQRDIFKKESGYLRAMYILWYESLGQESDIRASLARHHQIYRRDVARWIQQGIAEGDMSDSVDPHGFAAVYCATMFGSIYQWVVSSDALDIDSFFGYLEKMMLFYVQTAR